MSFQQENFIQIEKPEKALTSDPLNEEGIVLKNIATEGKIAKRMVLLLSSMRFVKTLMSFVLSSSVDPYC